MNIRDYRDPDIPYLYEICLKTGDNGKDATNLYSDPYMLGQFYAAPYAFFEPDCVLILEGTWRGISRPMGYILGTSNTAAYTEWFNRYWLPAAASLYSAIDPEKAEDGAKSSTEATVRKLFSQPLECPLWALDYPGHIHIDLLPEAQGSGWGRRLMDAMSERFSRKGCRGFHLGVSAANQGGIDFYRRYGMTAISQETWGIVFGKSL